MLAKVYGLTPSNCSRPDAPGLREGVVLDGVDGRGVEGLHPPAWVGQGQRTARAMQPIAQSIEQRECLLGFGLEQVHITKDLGDFPPPALDPDHGRQSAQPLLPDGIACARAHRLPA